METAQPISTWLIEITTSYTCMYITYWLLICYIIHLYNGHYRSMLVWTDIIVLYDVIRPHKMKDTIGQNNNVFHIELQIVNHM